jgi:protein phosphatase
MTDDPNVLRRAAVSKQLDVERARPFSSVITLEIGGMSVRGRLRPHNTDHYLALRLGRIEETVITSLAAEDLPARFEEYGYALLVADGLGAEGSGARASRLVLSALAFLSIRHGKWNVRADPDTSADIMEQAAFYCRRVSDVLREASRHSQLPSLATSLTAVYITEADLFFAHVGHSKAFLFRDGALLQLTKDHALDQRHLGVVRLDVEEPAKMEFGLVVTETIGGRPDPDVDIEHVRLSSGDRVLVCTNGLTDGLGVDEIADALTVRRRPQDDCQQLVDLAVSRGSLDDVTVMLADYGTP